MESGSYWLDKVRISIWRDVRTLAIEEAYTTKYSIHPGADTMLCGFRLTNRWLKYEKDIVVDSVIVREICEVFVDLKLAIRQDLGFIPSGNVVLSSTYVGKILGADQLLVILCYRYQESGIGYWILSMTISGSGVSTMRLGEVDKRDRRSLKFICACLAMYDSPFKATVRVLLFSWKMVSMMSKAALAEAGLVLIILFRRVGERVRKIHDFTMESAVIHSSVGGSDVDVDPSMWFSTLKLLQCPLKKLQKMEVNMTQLCDIDPMLPEEQTVGARNGDRYLIETVAKGKHYLKDRVKLGFVCNSLLKVPSESDLVTGKRKEMYGAEIKWSIMNNLAVTSTLVAKRCKPFQAKAYWSSSVGVRVDHMARYIFLPLYFDNLSPPVSLKMSEEDQHVEVVPPVKSDMHILLSTLTANAVKALAFKHNIPQDCTRVGRKVFFLDRRAIPQAMAWRHHDSDIHDPLPTDGFRASDVVALTNQSIDIRPVPSGLLFRAGLATTWEFSGFLPIFKDTEGNDAVTSHTTGPLPVNQSLPEKTTRLKEVEIPDPKIVAIRERKARAAAKKRAERKRSTGVEVVTMSEYLRFPFLDGATIEQGDVLSARDAITSHTTGPLPANQSLPEKTARLKEVEIPDPKIVAIRERKARAAAKKRAERKRAAGGKGGSKGNPKRRKVSVVRPEEEDSTKEASSASPLRTVAPNPSFLLKDVDEGTVESQEDEHVSVPNNDSANTNPDHAVEHDESFGESIGHGEDETRLTESLVPARNPEKTVAQDLVPMVRSNLAGGCADGAESSRPGSIYVPEWTIHRRSRVDTSEECRELLAHLAPPAVREEMNAYDNSTAMERAWFSIARGAMVQTDALLRFEALYDAHLVLKERCEDVTSKLVSTRMDFTHATNLYNTLSNRYQQVRGDHAGCAEKLITAERERDELRAIIADQVSQIKELEAELARKDSALVFSDRVSNERAVENEKLVSRLGYFEKEKIDSIGKLLPTVVKRLLNSHEYKESLSIPFNLAIQAGWAKGLAVKRSEKDLMDVLREVQGFDPYSDTRMAVEYDKLFTKTYPFVEKISGLPRRTVQELLKMYPAPPPPDAPTRVNPPSQAPDGSKSVPEGANV
ncbi:hypothetical protein Tco_0164181 [Tanacetum coccineum]